MMCNGCSMGTVSIMRLKGVDLWDWLVTHGVVAGEMLCPKCDGHTQIDTWLGDSTTCMKDVLMFCNHWLIIAYPKTDFLMDSTNFSRETVKAWSSFCRGVCISWADRPSQLLGGSGATVEIAVTKLCKKEAGFVPPLVNQLVIGGVERGSSKIFLVPVDNEKEETLLKVVKEKVRPDTKIISNCWSTTEMLSAEGYQHVILKDGPKLISGDNPAIHVQTVIRMWRDAKECVPKYCRTKSQLKGYLSEFVFRKAYGVSERLHHFLIETGVLYPPIIKEQ